MLDNILWLLGQPMQTLESRNVKTAGNRVTWHFLVGFKVQSASSTMDPTNQRIIMNSAGATKPTKKQTHHTLKPRKVNYACTSSSASTIETNIRQTLTYVHSGRIYSIENGTRRNTLRSVKTGSTLFIQLGIRKLINDLWQTKDLVPECLQKHVHCQHHPWDL